LSEKEIEVLASLLIEKPFSVGAVIVKEGDPVDSVYIIVSGNADVKKAAIQNNQIHYTTVATLGKNEAIGLNETGFYSLSGVRTATVTATTDMLLLCLSVAAFHGFALAYSHVSKVMRHYAEKVLDMNA
jgi:CRP-like cAMP-binding protein